MKHGIKRTSEDGSRSEVECVCGWTTTWVTPMRGIAEYVDHRMNNLTRMKLVEDDGEEA